MYATCGMLEKARKTIEYLHLQYVLAWSPLIVAYAQQIGYDESTRESVGIFVYPTQLLYFLWFHNTKAYLFREKKTLGFISFHLFLLHLLSWHIITSMQQDISRCSSSYDASGQDSPISSAKAGPEIPEDINFGDARDAPHFSSRFSTSSVEDFGVKSVEDGTVSMVNLDSMWLFHDTFNWSLTQIFLHRT